MTANMKRIIEIEAQISALQEEKNRLLSLESHNPYLSLIEMQPKFFGEWSEKYICDKCPSLDRRNQKGWDLWSDTLGRVEVKSCRWYSDKDKGTVNQCHPNDCDYFLFMFYKPYEGTEEIYLVPSKDFLDFGASPQHGRDEDAACYNVRLKAKKRIPLMEKYRISNWKELEEIAGGKNG